MGSNENKFLTENTEGGQGDRNDQVNNHLYLWLSDQELRESEELGQPTVQVVGPSEDAFPLPGLGFDELQTFEPPELGYNPTPFDQGTAMMANLQTFTAYRGPYDPYGSGDQSPWSATSDSFSSSSPASLMPPTPSYLVQPSIPVHGQGRPRSCSDPRAGGRDAPAPAATGVNPSLLLRLRDHQLRDHHASARVAPTTNAVASPSTSLPLVSNRPPGRPRASTGERLNAPLVYPNTSLYGYGSSLPVPIPASPSCSPNVEGRQRSRSVSRLSHRATPYSSLSSSPAFNPDETLPFHNLSVHSPSGSSVSHEMHPSPSGSVTLRLPQIKEKVTSPAVRAASFSRRTKDARLYCPFDGCGATFTRKHNLEGHIRAHTGERPFSCDYPGCSSEFARAGDLKRHKHIHDKAGRADMH